MIWLQRFIGELGKEHDMGTLYSDSQSAIHLSKNSTFHSRTKHIQLEYHFIWSVLEDGELKLEKIHTSQNPVEMLTKVVTREKLRICLVSICLQGWRWRWEKTRSKEESLSNKWSNGGVATIILQVGDCCVWSMIVQRSLFQRDVYPRKFCTPLHAGGCGGSALEAKNRCKFPL